MKSFAIIGLGLFGTQLAKELYNDGYSVLAIDSNEKSINQIADSVTRAACLDAKDRTALSQLGINKYDCVVVALSGDLAASVLVTMNLRALNTRQIICKVQNDTDREVLETLGADTCIIPEHIAATKMAKRLTGRNVIDFTQLSEDCSIIEISAPASWVGKTIMELNVRSKYRVNIIGIRAGGITRVDISPNDILANTDELIIIGDNAHIEKVIKLK